MARMIATIDITLKIPSNFKSLTGKQPIEIELKAEVPSEELSDNIVNYYTKNRPKVFRKLGEPAPETTPKGESGNIIPGEFNALEFLETNFENIPEAISQLQDPVRPKLLKIAKTLKLNDYIKQSNERIVDRIIVDIKAKKDQDEKLNKIDNE